MRIILLILFFLVSVLLILVIMLQKGKSSDFSGNSLNLGASTTLFGSSGSSNFMTRTTSILATLFFIISLIFGNITSEKKQKNIKNISKINTKSINTHKSNKKILSSENNDIPSE